MSCRLHSIYPWVDKPFIANAPMCDFAGPALATQVSLNGGLGFVGGSVSAAEVEDQLSETAKLLRLTKLEVQDGATLPVGIGFLLLFYHNVEEIIGCIHKHRPAAIWLFGAKDREDYMTWTTALRKASPQSAIWIQVGSVSDAIAVATGARPEVVVVQGNDAGGHGLAKGASVISMIPEVSDAFSESRKDAPILVASGGIADGRAVAAALTLGAEAAVMGTRFLASEEVTLHKGHRQAILNAKDGGQTTVRDKVFDLLRGPNPWPPSTDGRSIVSKSYEDYRDGKDLEEIRREYQRAIALPDGGYGKVAGEGRATVWAGTGVGLVRRLQKASDILEEVRREAQTAKGMLLSKLS